MDLTPTGYRLICKVFDETKCCLGLERETTRKRFMQRGRRMIKIVVTIDPDVVKVMALEARWKVNRAERLLLLGRTFGLGTFFVVCEPRFMLAFLSAYAIMFALGKLVHQLGFGNSDDQIGVDLCHSRCEGHQVAVGVLSR